MRFGIWTARWPLAGLRRALLFTGMAWLIIAVMVLRFALASVTADVLAVLVAAAADRQRQQRPDRAARDRLRARRPRGGQGQDVRALPAARRHRQRDWRRARARARLAVSRGLTEAMHGTLQPAQTPGGGLTMTMLMPRHPGRPPGSSAGLQASGGRIVRHVTGSSRDRDHPWNFRIYVYQQGESRSWRQRRRQVSLVRHDAGTMVAFAYAAAHRDSIITHRGARMRTSNIRRAAQVNRVTPGN